MTLTDILLTVHRMPNAEYRNPQTAIRIHIFLQNESRTPKPNTFHLPALSFPAVPTRKPNTERRMPSPFYLSPFTFHLSPFIFPLPPLTFHLPPFTFHLPPSTICRIPQTGCWHLSWASDITLNSIWSYTMSRENARALPHATHKDVESSCSVKVSPQNSICWSYYPLSFRLRFLPFRSPSFYWIAILRMSSKRTNCTWKGWPAVWKVLFHYRKPGPLGQVRVTWLCHGIIRIQVSGFRCQVSAKANSERWLAWSRRPNGRVSKVISWATQTQRV